MPPKKTRTSGLRPGQKAPVSGQYVRVGPRGGQRPGEVTAVRNKPLPPTPGDGETYKLVDKTKHRGR